MSRFAVGLIRISIAVCVTALPVACDKANAPEAQAPPSPTITPQHTPPQPPPPEERATRVLPLDSQTCSASDTTLIDFTSGEVVARCDSIGSTTRVLLTVLPRTGDPADYLQVLSLRFCGDVINAQAPAGWKIQIERDKGRSAVATDVTRELPDMAPRPKLAAPRHISGFTVTLRGQWRRGLGYYVAFSESRGPIGGSPHDCP